MKKNFMVGIVVGSLLTGTVGVIANNVYNAYENPFDIKLNGEKADVKGYNINDETYFKLRDISSVIGGFNVDFNNNTILLSKDGYIYDNTKQNKVIFNDDIKNYFDEYAMRIVEFTKNDLSDETFLENFIYYYYTGIGDYESEKYHEGYFDWEEEEIRQQYKLMFGVEMPIYHPKEEDQINVKYKNGHYEIGVSDYGDVSYVFENTVEKEDDSIDIIYTVTDSEGTVYGTSIFINIIYADNENGYIINSKTYVENPNKIVVLKHIPYSEIVSNYSGY